VVAAIAYPSLADTACAQAMDVMARCGLGHHLFFSYRSLLSEIFSSSFSSVGSVQIFQMGLFLRLFGLFFFFKYI